jgi:hypothetical protein
MRIVLTCRQAFCHFLLTGASPFSEGQMLNASKALKIATLWVLASTAVSAATFKDAVKGLGPGNSGVLVARELIGVLNLMSERLTYDEKARQFFIFLNDALEDFDFARPLRKPLPHTGQRRLQTHCAERQKSGFGVPGLAGRCARRQVCARKRARRIPHAQKRNPWGQNLHDATRVRSGAQEVRRTGHGAFIEGFLKVLDPENIKNLHAPASDAFPEVKADTRKVFDQGVADFPQTTRMLSKYLEFRSFAEIKTVAGKSYTDVSLRGHFKMAALEADYPQIRNSSKISAISLFCRSISAPARDRISCRSSSTPKLKSSLSALNGGRQGDSHAKRRISRVRRGRYTDGSQRPEVLCGFKRLRECLWPEDQHGQHRSLPALPGKPRKNVVLREDHQHS